jgi:hypothetical protein
MTDRLNALEKAFADELQMEKKAETVKTAADQIDEILSKMGAAIDGSDLMGKTNPVGKTNSGVDARSLAEGLSKVEAEKHGRGVAEKTDRDRVMQTRKLEQTVHDVPIMSPEEGSYPLRPTSGKPKVGSKLSKLAFFVTRKTEPEHSPERLVNRPRWEHDVSAKRREHFEDFLSLAEMKKKKALTEDEVDELTKTYSAATGIKVPSPKKWSCGYPPHEPFSSFRSTVKKMAEEGKLSRR